MRTRFHIPRPRPVAHALAAGSRLRRWHSPLGIVLLASLAAAGGCANGARLASVWRDPDFQAASLRKPMVVAVGRTPRERRLFEDKLASALRARGVDALPSYPVVGDERVDSARVDTAMHRMGCDGIFVARVVDRQTVTRYYPPAGAAAGYGIYRAPGAYHAGWWPYYSLGYAYATTAGYTIADQRISVETNLYRYADGRLVWSGLSRQWLSGFDEPGAEIGSVVRELAAEVVRTNVVAQSNVASRRSTSP